MESEDYNKLNEVINKRLSIIENKIDENIKFMIKEEINEAVKNHINEIKEVIFTELISTLISKNREFELKVID